jgi:hypothetical protein
MSHRTHSNLSICSALQMEWDALDGKHYKAFLVTPIAGKIPSKRLLPTLYFPDMGKFRDGDFLLLSFYEAGFVENLGQLFKWTVIFKIEKPDLLSLIKDIGPPAIMNADKMTSLYLEENDFLEKEKLRFEAETKYYKAEAYKKHLKKESESKNSIRENYNNETKGFDIHDVYTAFDGDTDSMNEFLGNH